MEIDAKYTRVTSVLSPFSGFNLIPAFILKNAAERGTIVHQACTAIMDDIGVPDLDEKYEGYIKSFQKWNIGKKYVDRPPRMYCDKYMITGEVDAIYEDEDGLVLVDFKTPLKESKTWPNQGSAYSYLLKVMGYDIKKIEFVKLCKNGNEPKVYVYQEDFYSFLEMLHVYNKFFKDLKKEEIEIDYL